MNGEDELPSQSTNTDDEMKKFQCTGCKAPISKYDEKCLNCERTNAYYIYK